MLPVKKLYIDSKARTPDSRSTTDFSIDLVESLTMPEGAAFQVCDVLIPHTWYLVDENHCKLYFFELNGPEPSNKFTLTLDTGNYDGETFTKEIGSKLHLTLNKLYAYSVTFDSATQKIHISATGRNAFLGPFYFKIMTDAEVLGMPSLGVTKPNSLNNFLGNTTPAEYIPDLDSYFSKRLQFDRFKYLFIKSTNLSVFNTLGSFGERTIIKKVPVTAQQNEMILDDTRSGNDMLSCEKQTLKRLEFQVTDELGTVLDLSNHDVSFSLIFSIIP